MFEIVEMFKTPRVFKKFKMFKLVKNLCTS